jgi:protoporphyrinogen oxidase
MNSKGKTVAILGAGPAGIAAAYFAQLQGYRPLLIEQKSYVGGKGASQQMGEFILDFGPHAYHPKSSEIDAMIQSHAGDDYLCIQVNMGLMLCGKNMRYPFQFGEALTKLKLKLLARILLDYLLMRLRRIFFPKPLRSFRDWGVAQYGYTLYNLCFGHYTERVWKITADHISVELAERKLPKFTLWGVLHDAFSRKSKLHEHILSNELGYHKLGMGAVYEKIVENIVAKGGQLFLNSSVIQVGFSNDKTVHHLTVTGEKTISIPVDYVVSTIPLPQLMQTLQAASSSADSLPRCVDFRSIRLVYVTLNKPRFSDKHWIYLVDADFHFHRISEQKNLSVACCPENRTVLTMEISCALDDPMWNWTADQFRPFVQQDLQRLGMVSDNIESISVTSLCDAYPIYTTGFEEHLEECFRWLNGFPNVISTGRQGLFLDIDMHDAMHLGKTALNYLFERKVDRFYQDYRSFKFSKKTEPGTIHASHPASPAS